MAIIRFCTKCDICGTPSEEYTAWPTCRVCGQDICPAHAQADTKRGGDGDPETVICVNCDSEDE